MSRALYVRTSTTDQDGAAQLHALRKAAAARGWADVREFVDRGVSGAKASRPALDELRRAVKAGEVSEVLAFALDRLGRSLRDLLLLLDDLTKAGCAVVTIREGLDLSTAAGRLQLHILGALAEFERELIRERVKSGMRRAADEGTRSGKAIGRPRREFDYKLARELRAAGKSWRSIAMAVKAPVRTVRRALDVA